MDAGLATRRMLLRRGLTLEYTTLGWNVTAVPILLITAVDAGSVALAGFGVDSLIEIIASAVVVWQLKGEEGSQRERAGAADHRRRVPGPRDLHRCAERDHPQLTEPSWPFDAGHRVARADRRGDARARPGKRDTGRRLGNRVLQTESRVTLIDGALAAAVLAGLILNAVLGWWWADPLSALVILTYGLREARHAWTEAGV